MKNTKFMIYAIPVIMPFFAPPKERKHGAPITWRSQLNPRN